MTDLINHPPHYTQHPSGIEAITITEHLGFNLGNAVKYLMRAPYKGQREADLNKAIWYLSRETLRRQQAILDGEPYSAVDREVTGLLDRVAQATACGPSAAALTLIAIAADVPDDTRSTAGAADCLRRAAAQTEQAA